MRWLITFQVYEYDEPLGPPRTVVTETHPVEFENNQVIGNPNRICAILFAMQVPKESSSHEIAL